VTGDDAGVDAAIVHLQRWAAESRTEDAADSRVRQHWARQQAEDEATLLSVLAGLAERGVPVAVHTGETVRGVVAGLGVDYVALSSGSQLTLVATRAVRWVRPDAPSPPASFADRVPAVGRLLGLLAGLAAERADVRVVAGGEPLAGELVAAGEDVLTLQPAGGHAGQVIYVPVASVSEVSVRLSG